MSLLVTHNVLSNSQFAKLREGVKNYRDTDLLDPAQERELGSFLLSYHVSSDSCACEISSFPRWRFCHLFILHTIDLQNVVWILIAKIDNPASWLVCKLEGDFLRVSSAIIASIIDHHSGNIIRMASSSDFDFYVFAFDLKAKFLRSIQINELGLQGE